MVFFRRTRSIRRIKAALIYRKIGNIRAVQLLLGHTKLDTEVRYLGVEVDTLAIAEATNVQAEFDRKRAIEFEIVRPHMMMESAGLFV